MRKILLIFGILLAFVFVSGQSCSFGATGLPCSPEGDCSCESNTASECVYDAGNLLLEYKDDVTCCTTDDECAELGDYTCNGCYCEEGEATEDLCADVTCDTGYCNPSTGSCVTCYEDSQCTDGNSLVCSPYDNTCIECTLDTDCTFDATLTSCDNYVCVEAAETGECTLDSDCETLYETGYTCDTTTYLCVEPTETGCTDDEDCDTVLDSDDVCSGTYYDDTVTFYTLDHDMDLTPFCQDEDEWCSETGDSGQDYYVLGTITGVTESGAALSSMDETCGVNEGIVTENYCAEEGWAVQETFNCTSLGDYTCDTGVCVATTPVETETLCDDGSDDDGDTEIDCDDDDCHNVLRADGFYCRTRENGTYCADGFDNDGDTYIDCADYYCDEEVGGPDGQLCDYHGEAGECDDLFDNDADGLTDCDDDDCVDDAACADEETEIAELIDIFHNYKGVTTDTSESCDTACASEGMICFSAEAYKDNDGTDWHDWTGLTGGYNGNIACDTSNSDLKYQCYCLDPGDYASSYLFSEVGVYSTAEGESCNTKCANEVSQECVHAEYNQKEGDEFEETGKIVYCSTGGSNSQRCLCMRTDQLSDTKKTFVDQLESYQVMATSDSYPTCDDACANLGKTCIYVESYYASNGELTEYTGSLKEYSGSYSCSLDPASHGEYRCKCI